MNCLTPHDLVSDMLDKLQSQLMAQLNESYFTSGEDNDYMLRPFQYGSGWMLSEPYSDMQFEYEYFNGSFVQICNVVEMLCGRSYEEDFTTELTQQVLEHVNGVIERHTEAVEPVAVGDAA